MTPTERRRLRRLHTFERAAWDSGATLVCGVDEVGRGPLAGPVAACAVVIAQPLYLEHLNDSKIVSALRRTHLSEAIRAQAVCYALGWATSAEIDRVNILGATKLAMSRALGALSQAPCRVLVDAVSIPGCPYPQESIIDGDAKSAAIAAASIIAKVARDEHMALLDAAHAGYNFSQNKGYGTAEHLAALARQGPCPEHRRSFAPVLAPTLALAYDGMLL
ncbi:MAG: ribonuclease HII [Candidatus Eremiobacteraeota bacterium]|nr:ribonuclease HII [Candidatus Eremiobacteraeota bacterium]